MAFDLLRWKKSNVDHARGTPPPRGSYEWVGVADMFELPQPQTRQAARPQIQAAGIAGQPSQSGVALGDLFTLPKLYEISFAEADAADRWIRNLYENIKYTRKVHGDKILTKADVALWDSFVGRWQAFKGEMNTWTARHVAPYTMWLKENKQRFDGLLNESRDLYEKFRAKGMSQVAIPYMGDLVVMLRSLPANMTLIQMAKVLDKGIICGKQLRDENTVWWQWRKHSNAKTLQAAVDQAEKTSDDLLRVADLPSGRGTRDRSSPIYQKFVRTLTKIWIEAAGLYGYAETQKTAEAQLKDDLLKKPTDTASKIGSDLTRLLVLAGVGYLGIRWLTRPTTTVYVKESEQQAQESRPEEISGYEKTIRPESYSQGKQP